MLTVDVDGALLPIHPPHPPTPLKHTEAIGTGSPKTALKDLKDKAKGAIKGNSSAAPATNTLATLADLNADVRDLASSYRDPAGALQQDKTKGECAVGVEIGAVLWA